MNPKIDQEPPSTSDFRFSFDIDNLTDKQYYETQNYFESRVTPTAPALDRIHATPGYPVGFTAGLTFRLHAK